LHDDEIGVVDVELDRLKERVYVLLLGFVTIEKILGYIRKRDLRIIVRISTVLEQKVAPGE